MLSLTLWVVVVLVMAGATALALQLGESVWSGGLLAPLRRRLVGIAASLGLLVALTLALKVEVLADADGEVVRLLARSRGDALTQIMTYLTTLGDAVPTFTIAAVLALIVHRQGVHRIVCWSLPALVLVEIFVQVAIGDVLDPLTIADVTTGLPIGGEGYIPSGSIARLSSLILAGALLLRSTNQRAGRALMSVGGVALMLEAVSRLYLGRHLVLDMIGGFALGLALFLILSLCVRPRAATEAATPTR